jgi:hypothetical protein
MADQVGDRVVLVECFAQTHLSGAPRKPIEKRQLVDGNL